jgi:hypothetical protein
MLFYELSEMSIHMKDVFVKLPSRVITRKAQTLARAISLITYMKVEVHLS